MPGSSPDPTPVAGARLKVLVVGSGGREHALVKACLRSPLARDVIAAPGNAGIAGEVTCFAVKADDVAGLVTLAKNEKVDFVIVGPEVPLCLGLADELAKAGIVAFGPKSAGAHLEGSKSFTKALLLRHKIPTAYGETFDTVEAASAYLARKPAPIVVKASGLAAGKGVTVAQTRAEAEAAVRDSIEKGIFGEGGEEVVIEDFMPGEEASIMLLVCGEKYALLPASQDHKRVGDGDTGPNTGGMGAYAPASVVTPELMARIEKDIIRPTLTAFVREQIDYRGVLYIGLMLTADGPKVVEFNVRFGDPECQVLLPLFENDPVQLMWDCARGQMEPSVVRFRKTFAATVVLAAQGYPTQTRTGDVITLPTPAKLSKEVDILHSATARGADGALVTSGGRVLNVTASAATLKAALDAAYAACAQVRFDGCHYRSDIGARQLARESAPAK